MEMKAKILCAASIIPISDHKILLQKRWDDECWAYHGGAMEPGESAEETARRELFEETGLVANDISFLGVFSGREMYHKYPDGVEAYIVDIVFVCEDFSGNLLAQPEEVLDLRWFDLDQIPQNITPHQVPVFKSFMESL